MKRIVTALAGILGLAAAFAATAGASVPSKDLEPYLGRWDVTLGTPQGELASWLEISDADGQPRVRLVGRWGHPRYLPSASLGPSGLQFLSPKEEEGRDTDMVFIGHLEGDALAGTTTGADGTPWSWRAVRAPSLERARAPKWGKPIALFDGHDLSRWHASDAAAKPAWQVANGVLVSPGRGADLMTNDRFGDFRLRLDFRCPAGANSGVYLRGRYEVQIEDDPKPDNPERRLGGIYGYLAPSPVPVRKSGAWRHYDITLVGRKVTVVLDGQTILRAAEIQGITGGALDSHEDLPGPIYLQGSEDGRVEFRNVVVTPARSE